MQKLQIQIPEKLDFLFEKARYKVAYGGRGASKSWAFARALLLRGWQSPIRVLCARELQNSIKESVHTVLSDQIKSLGLDDFYTTQHAVILGRNGTTFNFEGLRYNTDKIKSYEGTDICWVEEANKVSKTSWEVLIPTIRNPGSEIWISFNPELETDETYRRFVKDPPPNSIVRKVNWRDNPWFPDVLRQEMEYLKARDDDAYLNIWEGNCRVTLEGAIYANELREATREGRICKVPYDERVPVHTFWDLGYSDCNSIWFAQKVSQEYHVIDFYQNRLQKLPHYVKVIQSKPYAYGTDYLPHDAEHEGLGAESIAKQLRGYNRTVVTLQRIPKIQLGINAVRTLFNRLWFDEEATSEGLQALRHYKYDVDEYGNWSKDPLHDENSHAADALRTLGESIGLAGRPKEKPVVQVVQYSKGDENLSWMG